MFENRSSEAHRLTVAVSVEIAGVDGPLRVIGLQGRDAVSELYRFEALVAVSSSADTLTLDDLVGKAVHLKLEHEGDPPTKQLVHGMVVAIELEDANAFERFYRLHVGPRLYALTQSAHCRIFQDESVIDIAKKLVSEAGLSPSSDFAYRGNVTLPARPFTVQYQESDWDFLQRLFEDEGLFTFFEQQDSGERLVVGADAANHRPIEGESSVPFRAHGRGALDREAVLSIAARRAMRPTKVKLRDWHFPGAPDPLNAEHGAKDDRVVEDHPGGFAGSASTGSTRAKLRLEALNGEASTVHGTSTSPRLLAGHTFMVAEHDVDEVNAKYVVTEVEHEVGLLVGDAASSATQYQNRFRAQPATLPARPLTRTPRPRIQGIQSAMVVGKKGEEIDVDELGRVWVRFAWDRRPPKEAPSIRVRVAQVWGSAGYGAYFIPRIGQEVVVAFEDGDPDRPLIVGTVFHQAGPLDLPNDKTVSALKTSTSPGGGGANELRFDDKKDAELITVVAQKDLETTVKNDERRAVQHDQTLSVDNNRTRSVGNDETISVGNNQTQEVGKNQTISVGESQSLAVGKNRTTDVAENDTTAIGGSMTLDVGKDAKLTITKNLDVKVDGDRKDAVKKIYAITADKLQIDVKTELVIKAADSTLTFKGGKVTLKVDKDLTVDAGGAIKIKAGKDLDLQAGGKGNFKASGDLTMKGSKVTQN
jgi:type VI secretion system secreted protein VgrG